MKTLTNYNTEIVIPTLENTIKNLILQLKTCKDSEVSFIHCRLRQVQKKLRQVKK
jgi:hypothetical protein